MPNVDETNNEFLAAAGVAVTEKENGYSWTMTDQDGVAVEHGAIFETADDAEDDATFTVSSFVMGGNNLSSEKWDSMSPAAQIAMVKETYGPAVSSPAP